MILLKWIMTLIHADAAALMGYTGAVFERFFDAGYGNYIALVILMIWVAGRAYLAVRGFRSKSF